MYVHIILLKYVYVLSSIYCIKFLNPDLDMSALQSLQPGHGVGHRVVQRPAPLPRRHHRVQLRSALPVQTGHGRLAGAGPIRHGYLAHVTSS